VEVFDLECQKLGFSVEGDGCVACQIGCDRIATKSRQ
jgi:hypothetical protein